MFLQGFHVCIEKTRQIPPSGGEITARLGGLTARLKIVKNFSGLFGALCYIPAPLKHWPVRFWP
jgi:hypothetical protein